MVISRDIHTHTHTEQLEFSTSLSSGVILFIPDGYYSYNYLVEALMKACFPFQPHSRSGYPDALTSHPRDKPSDAVKCNAESG